MCPTMHLSHSLRVLSKSAQLCDQNVPRGFFLMYSQYILNLVQFHNKLSKKPLSIGWILCGHIAGHILKELSLSGSGIYWIHCKQNHERNQGVLLQSTQWPLWWVLLQCAQHGPTGHFVKELNMCPLADGWAHCLKNHNVITMYPLGKWPFAPSKLVIRSWMCSLSWCASCLRWLA